MKPSSHRRASAYLLVLGAGMLVMVMSVSAVMLARTQAATARLAAEKSATRQAAIDGLALATQAIPARLADRASLNPSPLVRARINNADVEVRVWDPGDADLADSSEAPIRLQSTARQGSSCQSVAANVSSELLPTPVAAFTLAVGGETRVLTYAKVDILGSAYGGADLIVSPHVTLLHDGWNICGNLTTTGSPVVGNVTEGFKTLALPKEATLEWLRSRATEIPFGKTGGSIRRCLLSPHNNPFGDPNPEGIYLIQCGGKVMRVEHCRIFGTLILLDPDRNSLLSTSVMMNPFSPELPALFVQGDFRSTVDSPLSESYAGNMNPPLAPYHSLQDADINDSYDSVIEGTVIITGNFDVSGRIAIDGALIVGGNLQLTSHTRVYLRYRPPHGFTPGLSEVAWKLDRTSFGRILPPP